MNKILLFSVSTAVLFYNVYSYDKPLNFQKQRYIDMIMQDSQEAKKDFFSLDVTLVTKANYEKEVLKSSKPAVILVSANWCQPCQIFKPIFYQVARSYKNIFKFINIDYDSFPDFVKKQDIESVPTLIVLNKGTVLEKIPSFITKNDLNRYLNFLQNLIQDNK